ncbi:MAG: serine/threonine-protein phosphatase [Lachnospiraceae bacterium]|nr:serine/threonine-protein phosphatase [Lachnospiraceae bacterium]
MRHLARRGKCGRQFSKRNSARENRKIKEPERIKSNKSSPVPFFCTEPVIGYGTHAGKKKINQDALLVMTAEADRFRNPLVIFACVFDGMGGHSDGEKASGIAAAESERWFRNALPPILAEEDAIRKTADSLKELFEKIHGRLRESGNGSPEREMGTTACVLLVMDGSYIAAHTGDSRIYVFSETPELITSDHSWVMEEFSAGRLRKEEMKNDPRRNVLMKCLGIGNGPEPDLRIGKRKEGGLYLLCSDGFWREKGVLCVRERYLAGGIRTREEADASVREGFEENLICGETDNMTAVLIRDRGEEMLPAQNAAEKGGERFV